MQLRKAHAVGVLDDEGVDVRDVDAGFDDRGADENLRFALGDGAHDVGELLLVHLPVRHGDGGAVDHFGDLERGALDVVDAVVEIIDLPAALQLAAHGVAEDVPVVLHDEGLHGHAVLRRLLDGRHVADAGEGHVERARNGRGREREHVDIAAELLDVLLVADAEALLLVDDEQAELLELHALLQQLVRADDEIALAGADGLERFAVFRRGLEAAEHADLDRNAEKPLRGRLIMLLGEHRRGHENRGLIAVEHALHDGAERDLGLAVADVSA